MQRGTANVMVQSRSYGTKQNQMSKGTTHLVTDGCPLFLGVFSHVDVSIKPWL